MPIRDGAVIRRERMQMLVEMIRKEPEGTQLERLQVTMSLRTGLKPDTTAKYLEELVQGGVIKIEGGLFKVTR